MKRIGNIFWDVGDGLLHVAVPETRRTVSLMLIVGIYRRLPALVLVRLEFPDDRPHMICGDAVGFAAREGANFGLVHRFEGTTGKRETEPIPAAA